MLKYFTAHPASVNETYLQHMEVAGSFAFWLLLASLCAALHAVFPFLCEKTASRIITRLHHRMGAGRIRRAGACTPAQQALDSAAL